MSFKINSLYLTDGYKVGHKAMLAPGTTKLYGTWIPRSTKHAPKGITKIVSFGQQLVWKWIHDEFEENFFRNKEKVGSDEIGLFALKQQSLLFIKDISLYLGMNYDGTHFEELWDLGYLPIKVKALPEGIETNPNIPHMTFVNTVDGFAWLTLYLETVVSALAWKPSTAATIAKLYRRQAEEWVKKTDLANMWLVDFMCHDFSARGLDPLSQSLIGLGHATSFKGSDTLPVIPAARYFYGVKEDEMPINSVNASEHSVSTTKIFTVGESQMITDWLKIFPKGILSIVSDTFDLWKLITEYLPANKDAIMARDGKLVIRPDSGDPVDIICGKKVKWVFDFINNRVVTEDDKINVFYTDKLECPDEVINNIVDLFNNTDNFVIGSKGCVDLYLLDERQCTQEDREFICEEIYTNYYNQSSIKGVIELLWDIFGGTINEQGYKVLDPHIGAIYGDSITPERQVQIYERLAAKGFAATNIILGIGSFTYQYNTRDTLGFAAKGAWFEMEEDKIALDGHTIIGKEKISYNIYKDPITDDGTKKSLKGLLQIFNKCDCGHTISCDCVNNNFQVKQECTPEEESKGLLQVIYEDGKFHNQTNLTEIRQRLK